MTLEEEMAEALLVEFNKPGHEVFDVIQARKVAKICADVVRKSFVGGVDFRARAEEEPEIRIDYTKWSEAAIAGVMSAVNHSYKDVAREPRFDCEHEWALSFDCFSCTKCDEERGLSDRRMSVTVTGEDKQ